MTKIETEFNTAVATARHALEQFKAEPLLPSKRGGPRGHDESNLAALCSGHHKKLTARLQPGGWALKGTG